MQWTDFGNLTNAQRTKLMEFAAIGTAMGGPQGNQNPNTSAVTYSQAKAVVLWMKELNDLVGPAIIGAKHVVAKGQKQAIDIFDQANP